MTSPVAGRVQRLRDLLRTGGIDALLVSNPTNIRYLCGFSGSNGSVVVTPSRSVLVTDSRYHERAVEELAGAQTHTGENVDIAIAPGAGHSELVRQLADAASIGLEADDLSWAEAAKFQELLGPERVQSTSGIVEELRELKSGPEIDIMREAAAIADVALMEVINDGIQGHTERSVQRRLDQRALERGAHGASFETIVASGPNAARPHHSAGDRTIAIGDLVIIDFGAELSGYRSDMTRSFILGQPNPEQRRMLEAVEAAQHAGVQAVSVGCPTSEIDAACRKVLADHDLDQYFTHGTGHGVGLDIHEAPSVSSTSTATLAPGHVITVEPGVYIPDVGGVRWEDTVVVTNVGVETLTTSPKQPVIDA